MQTFKYNDINIQLYVCHKDNNEIYSNENYLIISFDKDLKGDFVFNVINSNSNFYELIYIYYEFHNIINNNIDRKILLLSKTYSSIEILLLLFLMFNFSNMTFEQSFYILQKNNLPMKLYFGFIIHIIKIEEYILNLQYDYIEEYIFNHKKKFL